MTSQRPTVLPWYLLLDQRFEEFWADFYRQLAIRNATLDLVEQIRGKRRANNEEIAIAKRENRWATANRAAQVARRDFFLNLWHRSPL